MALINKAIINRAFCKTPLLVYSFTRLLVYSILK